jgi:hypothetical protein
MHSPITKAKLATEVAKKVDRLLKVGGSCWSQIGDIVPIIRLFQDMQRSPRNSQWIPPSLGHVTINHLALVALEHVSMASWQPHLRPI